MWTWYRLLIREYSGVRDVVSDCLIQLGLGTATIWFPLTLMALRLSPTPMLVAPRIERTAQHDTARQSIDYDLTIPHTDIYHSLLSRCPRLFPVSSPLPTPFMSSSPPPPPTPPAPSPASPSPSTSSFMSTPTSQPQEKPMVTPCTEKAHTRPRGTWGVGWSLRSFLPSFSPTRFMVLVIISSVLIVFVLLACFIVARDAQLLDRLGLADAPGVSLCCFTIGHIYAD